MNRVTTLGQPFEVLKVRLECFVARVNIQTHMAANRQDNIFAAFRKTWARGGVFGYYQRLIPWVDDIIKITVMLTKTGMD